MTPDKVRLHATCVAVDGRGLLILGASGSGKSGFALQLMAYGATLVSDDQTLVQARDGWPVACTPQNIAGMIEARGIGLLHAHYIKARVVLALDLDQIETARLPEPRTLALAGREIPLLHKFESPYFAASVLQYLRTGKAER